MTTQRFVVTLLLIATLLVPGTSLARHSIATTRVPLAWTIEVVDTEGQVGKGSSLELDPDNNPHISYLDLSHDALKHAYQLVGDWQFEIVATRRGIRDSSLALDLNGYPRIAYSTFDLETLMSYLRYVFKGASGWHTETIDTYGQYAFTHPSLVIRPDGNPCLSYGLADPSEGGLMYACRDAGGWHRETVSQIAAASSLDFDADGNPHIVYQPDYWLVHAYRDGSGWHYENIEETGGQGGNSLAFDGENTPHVAYYNIIDESLKHAWKSTSGWHTETVAGADNVIQYLDLSVNHVPNAEDRLHISYSDDGSRILKHAYRDATGWHTAVVDNSDGYKLDNSIALDSQGAIYISYNVGNQELRLAMRPAAPPSPPVIYARYLPVVTNAGDVVAKRIARWDGTTWHPLSSGINEYGDVNALAVGSDGSLYAGGSFTTAGGVETNNVARWDGTTWFSLSSGINDGYVKALAMGSDGELFAAGSFTTAGDVAAKNITCWDGLTWDPLGSGIEGSFVSALAFGSDDALYAGGLFSIADGVPSSNIARWGEMSPSTVTLASFTAGMTKHTTARGFDLIVLSSLALLAGAALACRSRRRRVTLAQVGRDRS